MSLNLENLRFIPAKATIREDAEFDEVKLRTAIMRLAQKEAALAPYTEDMKPRMLLISAWICHAGKPNLNRDAFVAEDLEAAVQEKLFQPPYFGMIDFNHDFSAYGVWYDAKYEFDPVANEYGVIAEGAIFAWRYEELTDKVLAMQARQGHIDVSMACIPQSIEIASDEEGDYFVLRQPIFFTTSVLDVDPADVHGRGIGTEDPDKLSEIRKRVRESATQPIEEEVMDEKMLQKLAEVLGDKFDEFKAQVEGGLKAAEELASATKTIEELQAKVEELTAKVAEVETQKDEAGVALSAAKEELATVIAERDELKAFKDEWEAKEAEKAANELREARLAQISEAARKNLESLEDDKREKIIASWVAMSEEDWADHIVVMNLAGSKKSYSDRAAEEGDLVTAPGSARSGKFEIDEFFDK